MKLSISNIGWSTENDIKVYELMRKHGYSGLEIAPTRIFPEAPYDRVEEAAVWSEKLKEKYGFGIPSMQSIWFGRQEKIFGFVKERKILLDYTKKAIDFAAVIHCGNLVFGCPRNRCLPEGAEAEPAIEFFRELGNYAVSKGTVIGMEANPPIYHTNYINDTASAIDLVKRVDSRGFLLNLDVGTMIQNGESVDGLKNYVHLISHVHISEPGLKPIEKRKLHKELSQLLKKEGYRSFISIEMGKTEELSVIEKNLEYIKGIFL